MMKQIKHIFPQFFKFGVVGLINTVIFYAVYSILVSIGLHYISASIIAFFLSVLCSFFLNNKFVFKNETDCKRNILLSLIKCYLSYAFTGLIIYNILLFSLIDILLLSKYIAPVLILPITVPLNFIFNKLWAFKPAYSNKTEVYEKD